ncbi:AzlD domain-containing protein [Clostridiaceae bacterium M8S5]|nr:AzlD domain-containing protein [Clostridiaceae bacterium M8S5]
MQNNLVFIIVIMAILTYLTRIGSLIILRFTGIPTWLEKIMKYIPTAILTSLIVPSLLLPKGYIDLTLNNHYLIAGIVAIIIAIKKDNIILVISSSMTVILALNWLEGVL